MLGVGGGIGRDVISLQLFVKTRAAAFCNLPASSECGMWYQRLKTQTAQEWKKEVNGCWKKLGIQMPRIPHCLQFVLI